MPTELLRLAEAHVPGEGPLEIEFLSAGLAHETYRVRRAARSFSLRLASGPVASSRSDRAFEFEILRSAARVGVAPGVQLADPDRGLLICDWLEGEALSAEAAGQRSRALVDLLHTVHGLPIPAEPRLMSPGAWVEHYRAALKRAGGRLRGEWTAPIGACLKALDARPEPPRSVCHSDLHRLNVLKSAPVPESLVLLDWEYTHVSEAFWDLAGWSANNDFAPAAQVQLLTDYLARPPSESEARRFSLLHILYDYVCLLWMDLCAAVKPAQRTLFAARATALETRLKSSFCGTIALPADVVSLE